MAFVMMLTSVTSIPSGLAGAGVGVGVVAGYALANDRTASDKMIVHIVVAIFVSF